MASQQTELVISSTSTSTAKQGATGQIILDVRSNCLDNNGKHRAVGAIVYLVVLPMAGGLPQLAVVHVGGDHLIEPTLAVFALPTNAEGAVSNAPDLLPRQQG